MFDRFSNSWSLGRSSWDVLRSNRSLLLFPIVSAIGCVLVLISFVTPMIVMQEQLVAANPDHTTWWTWAILFAYYFCNYFVIVFCNAALISCALMHFNGQQATVADGFRAAFARLPQIFAWSLVSATVGVLLKAIELGGERVGEFVSAILGTAWSIMTYFVVPVLVVERVGPFDAVGRSVSLLKKTWGESLIGGFGIFLFSLVLLIPVVALAIVTAMLFAANPANPVFGYAALVCTLLAFAWWAATSSALGTIYMSALYQYAAHDQIPDGFEAETIHGAFQPKMAS